MRQPQAKEGRKPPEAEEAGRISPRCQTAGPPAGDSDFQPPDCRRRLCCSEPPTWVRGTSLEQRGPQVPELLESQAVGRLRLGPWGLASGCSGPWGLHDLCLVTVSPPELELGEVVRPAAPRSAETASRAQQSPGTWAEPASGRKAGLRGRTSQDCPVAGGLQRTPHRSQAATVMVPPGPGGVDALLSCPLVTRRSLAPAPSPGLLSHLCT